MDATTSPPPLKDGMLGISKAPSTKTWILIHVVLPLMPFILVAILRGITFPKMGFQIFNGGELALTMGLISIFIYQDLVNSDFPLSNPDKEDEVNGVAALHLICAIVFIVIFAATEIFTVLWKEAGRLEFKGRVDCMEVVIVLASFLAIWRCIETQRCFKLKARFGA